MPEGSIPRILLTNDDGIDSEGLVALEEALASMGRVTTVAPLVQRSACSRAITLYSPVRYDIVGPERYAVHGTPVDAVILALNHILPEKPKLLVSGINRGGNRGQNVFYSGTVGAAIEGTVHGVPSIAVSLCSGPEFQFGRAAEFVVQLGARIVKESLPPHVTLNINVPKHWKQGVRLTKLGVRSGRYRVLPNEDSRDSESYWIKESLEEAKISPDSDYAATREGHISITPLVFECEEVPAIGWLEQWLQSSRMLPVA